MNPENYTRVLKLKQNAADRQKIMRIQCAKCEVCAHSLTKTHAP